MGSDDESKLAAPKLFGRKKSGRTPPAVTPARDAKATESEVAAPEVAEPEVADDAVPEVAEPEVADDAVPEPADVLEQTPAPATEPAHKAASGRRGTATTQPPEGAEERPAKQPKPPKPERSTPILSGTQAAAFAGLLVGAFLVLATFGSLNLCSTVRGASTCGGGAGFPLLLAIGVVAVVGGAALLRAFRVTSALGDSFLAVALVAVLTVLFLHNHYDAWWMIIAVPVLTILAFLLAHWVSVTYIDPMDE